MSDLARTTDKAAGEHPADILRMHNITMKFGGVAVLKDVSLSLRRAEILGLLGANGSGKSTLIKVLAGFNSPEPGSVVRMWGNDMTPPLDPARIRRLGVAFVHQHLGLVPSLTVAENMLITEDRRRNHWRIKWGAEYRALRELFAEFGLDIDPKATVETLPMVERALLAILRAVRDLRASDAGRAGEGILVLDEPTPFLTAEDVDKLFGLLRAVKKTGTSVIIVT
ncbi:MAG: ATP-binding cassette domain-containing protein, partial [Pseudomonadota bacterium]